MIARITEAWAAAPTPCRKRAPISAPSLGARPHSSEATVKITRPVSKTHLRPARSPRRPASSSRLPNVMRKALTTQVRPAWLKWRSCWIEGSATFTIVTSSTIISWARQTTMSAAQRRWSMEGAGAETTVIGDPPDLCGRRSGAKMEGTSEKNWRLPPELYGGTLRFVKRFCHEHRRDPRRHLARTPEARRRAAQLREGARRRPRGVRRRWRVHGAGGDRAPGRRRDRHAVSQLPQPPGAPRGAVHRRGRGGLPHRRAARRRRPVAGPQRLARALHRLHRHEARARGRAAQLPRPGRVAVPDQPSLALCRRRAAA